MCKIMSGEVLGWTLRVLMNPDVLLTINGCWGGRVSFLFYLAVWALRVLVLTRVQGAALQGGDIEAAGAKAVTLHLQPRIREQ